MIIYANFQMSETPRIWPRLSSIRLCGYEPKNLAVLLDQDATKDKIGAGLDALKHRCDAESTVFLYFSGHGGQIKDGANKGQYLLPVDVVYPGDDDLARTASRGPNSPRRSGQSRRSG